MEDFDSGVREVYRRGRWISRYYPSLFPLGNPLSVESCRCTTLGTPRGDDDTGSSKAHVNNIILLSQGYCSAITIMPIFK